jgi:hypothetical protein
VRTSLGLWGMNRGGEVWEGRGGIVLFRFVGIGYLYVQFALWMDFVGGLVISRHEE